MQTINKKALPLHFMVPKPHRVKANQTLMHRKTMIVELHVKTEIMVNSGASTWKLSGYWVGLG